MLAMMLTLLTGLPALQAPAAQVPEKLELFAKEEWYKTQKGDEKEFVGVLQRLVRPKGTVGIGRYNEYRLVIEEGGKKDVREVYVGAKPELLAPYVGKRVSLVGKPVEIEVVGKVHREIWPARLAVIQAPNRFESPANPAKEVQEVPQAAGKQLKVIAQGTWPYASASPKEPRTGQQFVIRSAAELVAKSPFANLDINQQAAEKQATEAVAKLLKVDGIDWRTQMLVVVTAGARPTGGYKLDITGFAVNDRTLTVTWLLTAPKGAATQAFTHPARVALVERFEGEVKFQPQGQKLDRQPQPLPIDRLRPGKGQFPPEFFQEQPANVAGGERQVKVIAQTPGRVVPANGHTIIRSAAELVKAQGGKGDEAAATAALAKQFKTDIEWTKHMVIAISGGVQRTGGYSVVVKDLTVKDQTLTVNWMLKGPGPNDIVTQALTRPVAVLLVERFGGEVRFDPATAPGGFKGKLERR